MNIYTHEHIHKDIELKKLEVTISSQLFRVVLRSKGTLKFKQCGPAVCLHYSLSFAKEKYF